MKKLLALVLVLAFASLSNAAFMLSVDGVTELSGPITVAPGTSLVLGVYGSNNGNMPQDFWILVQGSGMTTGGSVQYVGSLTEITTDTPAGWEIDFEADSGYAGVKSATYANIADGAGAPAALNGQLIGSINLVAGSSGAIALTLISGDYATVFDTQAFVIPEPATMALLALGGLLFRRK